jgi:hypothetical protein
MLVVYECSGSAYWSHHQQSSSSPVRMSGSGCICCYIWDGVGSGGFFFVEGMEVKEPLYIT